MYEYIPEATPRVRRVVPTAYEIYLWVWWLLIRCRICKPLDVRDASRIVEKHTSRNSSLRVALIDHLNKMELVGMSKEHTHKAAAQNRTSANVFMNEAVRRAGYTPYNVSRSNHDIEGGSRYFYNIKDVGTPFRDDTIEENTALVFCDVDYYCDMNRWLKLGKPCLLYTLVPQTLSHRGPDYAYTIRNDVVRYRVSGGAEYEHQLWNYEGDSFGIVNDDGDLIIYQVEQKIVPGDDNRRFIWFVPCAVVEGPYWRYLYPDSGSPSPLKRRSYVRDEHTNFIYEPITDRLSVARNGEWQSIELAGRTFEAIRKRMANKTSPPVIADVERILRESENTKSAPTDAPLLFELIAGGPLRANIVRTTVQAAHFQPIGPLATEDGTPSGLPIANTLVETPAVFPTKGFNSDTATIKGRVTAMTNNVRPTKNYKVWANEFIQLLVPDPGKGNPLSVEEVRAAQKTPNQRARFQHVKDFLRVKTENTLKAFIKAEPYGGPNDPRNITTMSPENTIMFSTFSHAFKRHMKRFKWYGPGMTPKQVAVRLGELARQTGSVLDGDYSRMDGTHSAFTNKHIVRPAYMRWCAPEHRAELKGHFDAVYRKRAVTASGIVYDPAETNRSGSSITTEVNTLVAAFNIYCALRELGYSTTEAFELIGFVFGDDTNNPDLEGLDKALEKTAADLGLTLKVHRTEKGDPVPCLGRYFVDPAVRTDSFQDPMRTLGKLHLTSNKQVTAEQALVNKASGYINTDRLTPLIGTWAKKVLDTHGTKTKGLTGEEVYKCSMAWPQKDRAAITTAMAKVLGIETSELTARDNLLLEASLDQVPVLLGNTAEPRITVVVDDVIVGPAVHNNESKPEGTRSVMQEAGDGDTAGSATPDRRSPRATPRPRSETGRDGLANGQSKRGPRQPGRRKAGPRTNQPAKPPASQAQAKGKTPNKPGPSAAAKAPRPARGATPGGSGNPSTTTRK
nr:MAG: hypothetical protein [Henan sediment noda-like virus 2]